MSTIAYNSIINLFIKKSEIFFSISKRFNTQRYQLYAFTLKNVSENVPEKFALLSIRGFKNLLHFVFFLRTTILRLHKVFLNNDD